MESFLRAVAVYGTLMVLFRLTGKRSLGQLTTFDLILLLIISEAAQNGLVGENYSLTHAVVLITTLVVVDIVLSLIKPYFPRLERLLEGVPLIIVADGRPLHDRMKKARVDEGDILQAARLLHGLERMEQIKYAVLEKSGDISIIPAAAAAAARREAA